MAGCCSALALTNRGQAIHLAALARHITARLSSAACLSSVTEQLAEADVYHASSPHEGGPAGHFLPSQPAHSLSGSGKLPSIRQLLATFSFTLSPDFALAALQAAEV